MRPRTGGGLRRSSEFARTRARFSHVLQQLVLAENIDLRALAEATGIPYTTLLGWAEIRHSPRFGDPRRAVVAEALGRTIEEMNGLVPLSKPQGGDEDARAEDE